MATSIRKTVEENASDLIVLGWPGYTNTSGQLFGSVIDPIVDNPPADIAVVRYRRRRAVHTVLVPVAGGPNSRRAVKMAVNMAQAEQGAPARVVSAAHRRSGQGSAAEARSEQFFREALEGIEYGNLERRIVEGVDVVETMLKVAEGGDDCPPAT